jgi:four helix bundle protein
MGKYNILQEKSFKFAVRVVNFYKYLCEEKKEYVLSKQILRSGTSVGANIEESIGGQSEKDFVHKLSISYKELRETIYWLKLLKETKFVTNEMFDSLFADADELGKIMGKIKITMSKKLIPS